MKRTTAELIQGLKGEEQLAEAGQIVAVLADHYLVRIGGSAEMQQVWPTTHNAIPATTAQRSALVGRRCVVQRARERWYIADILAPESGSASYQGSTEPGVPVITAVVPTMNGFWVEWTSIPFAAYYEVYTNEVAAGLSPLKLNNTTANNYLLAYADSQGYVAVRAIGLDGEPSDISEWVICDDAPGMPLNFSSEIRQTGHHFSWHNQSYTDVVRIYRDDDGTGEPTNKVWEGRAEEGDVPFSLAEGDTFFCAVAVGYNGSESLPTPWIESDPTPATPQNLVVQMGQSTHYISWDDADNVAVYELQRAEDDSGTNAELVWSGLATSQTVVYDGSRKFFRIRARGYDWSYSDWSDWEEDTTAPDTPGGFSVVNGVGQVVLEVNFVVDTAHTQPGFRYFVAEEAEDAGGTGAAEIGRFSDSTFVWPLEMGTERYYRIKAVDWPGNESGYTSWTIGQSLRDNAGGDDFSGYGDDDPNHDGSEALFWLQIHTFDEDESWTNRDGVNSVTKLQGTHSSYLTLSGAETSQEMYYDWPGPDYLDLDADGRFEADDFVYLAVWVTNITDSPLSLRLKFYYDTGTPHYYYYDWSLGIGWNLLNAKRSDFTASGGTPSWDNILRVGVVYSRTGTSTTTEARVDDLRAVKADPDDPSRGNDTGGAWDFSGDWNKDGGPQWHVEGPDDFGDAIPYALANLNYTFSAEMLGVWTVREFNNGQGGFRFFGRVMPMANSDVGFTWFVRDYTEGSEDLYVINLDPTVDTVYVRRAVNGVYTTLGSRGFVIDPGNWYFCGIEHLGSQITAYFSDHPNVFQPENVVCQVSDATYSWGKIGVYAEGWGRFADIHCGSPEYARFANIADNVIAGAGYGRDKYVAYASSPDDAGGVVPQGGVILWIDSDT